MGLNDWWEDVFEVYDYLKLFGYMEIVVVGFLFGGFFLLKLGFFRLLKGIIVMSILIRMDSLLLII